MKPKRWTGAQQLYSEECERKGARARILQLGVCELLKVGVNWEESNVAVQVLSEACELHREVRRLQDRIRKLESPHRPPRPRKRLRKAKP
jgi:hypothetical protein